MGGNKKIIALAVAAAMCGHITPLDKHVSYAVPDNGQHHGKRGKKGKQKKDWQR